MLSGLLLITLQGSILRQENPMPENSLSTRLGVKSRYVDPTWGSLLPMSFPVLFNDKQQRLTDWVAIYSHELYDNRT